VPQRARLLRTAVQKTNLAPDFAPFFAFVNDGVATWIHDGVEHSFDVTSSPTHAEVQRVVREALTALHDAAPSVAAGDAVSPVAHQLDRLAPIDFADSGDDATVEECDRRIAELQRRITDAAPYELCKARLMFLEDHRFDAFRTLGRCVGCSRWFLRKHGGRLYCSSTCRRRRS
jgi:hypothetical protein